jgi:hypothetical protein
VTFLTLADVEVELLLLESFSGLLLPVENLFDYYKVCKIQLRAYSGYRHPYRYFEIPTARLFY